MIENGYRKFGVSGFFILLLLVLILKLFHLQIIDKKYRSISNTVSVLEEQVIPSRGAIYDRNGELIVYNAPVYDMYLIVDAYEEDDSSKITEFLAIENSLLQEKLAEAKSKGFWKRPYPLLKGLSETDYAVLQEDLYRYPALTVKTATQRRYRYPNGALLLGYMGEVDSADIANSEEYYKIGDVLGKTGIERYHEDSLKGEKGLQYLLRDKNSVVVGRYKDGDYDVPATPGKDLRLTIDIELQAYAERLMNGKVGSLVAIDPQTGEILSMLSSPSYDPNWLTGRQRNKYFRALLVDSLKPMFNRAVSAEYPPGSTFKPLASLIALETGSVTEDFRYPCSGGYARNRGKPGCHAHSPLTGVTDAIRQSCNAYYAENFRLTLLNEKYANTRVALDDWYKYMTFFGYDTKFDIGIDGIREGFFPDSEYYDNIYNDWNWGPMAIISLAIGQGETLATTLQMAQSTAVIANRGDGKKPHLLKDEPISTVYENEKPISPRYFDVVVDGMEQTFLSGTARGSQIDSISACGKTGTAENFAMVDGKRVQLDDHSLFVAFAPKENPKIALAVIIENGGYGSTYAAPIASLVIEKYLKDSIPENRKYIEKRMLESNLIGLERDNYLEFVAEQQARAEERKRKAELEKLQLSQQTTDVEL